MNDKIVLPGEKLAVQEEYLAGVNTYYDNGIIRANCFGKVSIDNKKREISVTPLRKPNTIQKGESVIGQVESVQTNLAYVRIYYSNDKATGGFLGMLSWKGREENKLKLGDIVKCFVSSTANNIIHLSIEGQEYGVLHALCSRCGNKLEPVGSNKARCAECGNVEYRKFAKEVLIKS